VTDEEMISEEDFFAPRNLGGVIVRFMPTEDGGAEVMSWNGNAWVPADISAGDLMEEGREPSSELLEARGVPSDEQLGIKIPKISFEDNNGNDTT
jgi:hypothetical protein